ncbi:hypothetical protein HOLleu_26087 [Holothuria leucospilota]|uniref:Uncharacterized protein n=1 Tax=Holothuria leucospilota TaxID=206669 RepID=A0A9Q1H4Z5_HOLLE|nr:hypothetical protein HOLleu_26087 [Holothuria leucospilota]
MSGKVQCGDRPLTDAVMKRRLWKNAVLSKEGKREHVKSQSRTIGGEIINDEESNQRLDRLQDQLAVIREDLLDMRRQDQVILRQLLSNYATFLQLMSESQHRLSSRRSRSCMTGSPGTVTDFRLDTVKSFQSQRGDLNIRDISRRLYPPIKRRHESEPPLLLGHSDSFSFEKAFEGVFSDDEEIDPLSASSFT